MNKNNLIIIEHELNLGNGTSGFVLCATWITMNNGVVNTKLFYSCFFFSLYFECENVVQGPSYTIFDFPMR